MAYLEAINGVNIHDASPFLPQRLPEFLPHQLHLLATPLFISCIHSLRSESWWDQI